MDFPLKKSPQITAILQQPDAVAQLITLIDHPKHKAEAIWNLSELGDRQAIVPILEQARKEENNGLHFFALTAFNCEEYLTEILQLSIISCLESKMYTIEILEKLTGIESKRKKVLISSLMLQKELMKNEKCINLPILNYVTDCIKLIKKIPETDKAKVFTLH